MEWEGSWEAHGRLMEGWKGEDEIFHDAHDLIMLKT